MDFNIATQYELKLSWDGISYPREGVCNLKNTKLSGNALAIATEIQANDSLKLDFYKQYYSIVEGVYVADLSWKQVTYNKDKTVTLGEATITHNSQLHVAPKFKDTDYILIDTRDHEEYIHMYSFVYKSYVLNTDGQLYKFEK